MSEVNENRAAGSDAETQVRAEEEATVSCRPGNAPSLPKGLAPELTNHPRYRIVALLGEGGMGTVYQAEHRIMKRPVALKVINHRLVDSPCAVERFHREVQAAARLSHPNIVTAHDADCVGNLHFLIMELVDGVTLDRLVARKGALPVAEACDSIRQAALGLQHAHEHGMVHRDIKPHNLMLTGNGQVKILDFGLARFVSENGPVGVLTESGIVAGTPDYIAPEQAEDAHQADIRADIYSLGCTLYFLLTGQPPFPGVSVFQKLLAHHTQALRPLREFRDDLPPGLVEVVQRMTAKEPADRYQTPAEVARAFLPICAGASTLAEREPAISKTDSPARSLDSECKNSGAGTVSLAETDSILPRVRTPAETSTKGAAATETGPRSRIKTKPTPGYRSRMIVVALCLAIGFLLAAGMGGLIVLTFRPGPGSVSGSAAGPAEVYFRSEVPEAEVIVRHEGQAIQTLRPGPGQRLKLPPGTYDFELAGEVSGYRLSSQRLVLAPGEQRSVDVQRDNPLWKIKGGRPLRPRFPPPHPGPPPPHPGDGQGPPP